MKALTDMTDDEILAALGLSEEEQQTFVKGSNLAFGKGFSSSFDTELTPEEETDFTKWKQQYAPKDSGADYDLRGAFKAGLTPDPKTGHWPDTFKKPNHPTFSDESQYAPEAPEKAGHWNGDTFIRPKTGAPVKGIDIRHRK
jgi:hypothetical protein